MQIFDEIPERLFAFIQRAHLFFVATAPLEGGSVNVSPKAALGAFEIVNKNRVRYLDFTGSGNETISHLLQPGNGRITVMFINIEEGPPNIIRLYGKGSVHERLISGPESDFEKVVPSHQPPPPPGTRAVIDIALHTCITSCGYSLPIFKYVKERPTLTEWAKKMEESTDLDAIEKRYKKSVYTGDLYMGKDVEGRPAQRWIEAYWGWANALSIDGLPGLKISRDLAPEEEKSKVLAKRDLKDALEPPKDDAGPFRPAKLELANATESAGTSLSAKSNVTHLAIAFTMGCALTVSLFMAPRIINVL